MVLIPLCKSNLNLPIYHAGYYAFKKKKRLTTNTAFLISNISNILSSIFRTPYFKFKVRLIDLFQSDIQTLNGLQIDKVIWQCVNSSWTGVFKNKLVY